MAVDAKLEITLKFSTLPQAKSAGQGKMAFALKIPDGQFVTAEISNKVWNKLVKTNTDWLQWVAALAGTMGPRTEQGFQLNNPGLQVFERTPKAPAEAVPSPADTAPAPASPLAASAPVEPASRPPAAATIPPTSPTSKPVLSLKTRKITP